MKDKHTTFTLLDYMPLKTNKGEKIVLALCYIQDGFYRSRDHRKDGLCGAILWQAVGQSFHDVHNAVKNQQKIN